MFNPWRIIERLQGHVESWEPGQREGDWSPIWRSRRLNTGGKFRVNPMSACRLNLADLRSYVIKSVARPVVIEITDDSDFTNITSDGQALVFYLKFEKVNEDVATFFGKQHKFRILEPGQAIASRG